MVRLSLGNRIPKGKLQGKVGAALMHKGSTRPAHGRRRQGSQGWVYGSQIRTGRKRNGPGTVGETELTLTSGSPTHLIFKFVFTQEEKKSDFVQRGITGNNPRNIGGGWGGGGWVGLFPLTRSTMICILLPQAHVKVCLRATQEKGSGVLCRGLGIFMRVGRGGFIREKEGNP